MGVGRQSALQRRMVRDRRGIPRLHVGDTAAALDQGRDIRHARIPERFGHQHPLLSAGRRVHPALPRLLRHGRQELARTHAKRCHRTRIQALPCDDARREAGTYLVEHRRRLSRLCGVIPPSMDFRERSRDRRMQSHHCVPVHICRVAQAKRDHEPIVTSAVVMTGQAAAWTLDRRGLAQV